MGEIKTDRLLLRECREGDAVRIAEIADNKNIANNMADAFPHPCTLEAAEKWIESMIEPEAIDKNFVIIFEGEIVGGIGFKLKKGYRKGTASGGFWLGEDYCDKGIATEAWGVVVDYVFENFDVRRIDIGTFSSNPASGKILEKCGFVRESCMEDSLICSGKVCDEIRYGLLKGEWEVLNNKI